MTRIDVVSGFLGAGKTTFCNRLLSFYLSHGENPVYLVNEFGSTGLDGEILNAEGFQVFEMDGGCVCCTLKDNFLSSMKTIIQTYHPSRIVFEPSGIFIFDNFMDILKDDFLKNHCCLGNIITIVDCKNFHQYPFIAGSFVYNQIKNSPVLVLSKLAESNENITDILCDLKNLNPKATILAKSWQEFTDNDFNLLEKTILQNEMIQEKITHPHFQSITVDATFIFTKKELHFFRNGIKNEIFGQILRIKGIVKTETGYVLLNKAFNSLTVTPIKATENCRITFIGSHINKSAILSLFANS